MKSKYEHWIYDLIGEKKEMKMKDKALIIIGIILLILAVNYLPLLCG